MSDKNKIKYELKIISSYNGLIISKYLLFFLLAISFFPMNTVPGYILFAGIIFPGSLKFAFDDNFFSKSISEFTLSKTAARFKFSFKNYKAENLNFILMILLLMVWQYSINKNAAFDYPLNIIPSLMLIIYIASRYLIKIIFCIKLHHNFMNMNI